MRGAIVVVALLIAGSAQAQVTTCTNYVAGQVRCETQQPFAPNVAPTDYSKYLAPAPAPDAPLRAFQDAQARSRQQLIQQVAPLMAAGQCETARLMAVQHRDAELADLIYSTCKPAQ